MRRIVLVIAAGLSLGLGERALALGGSLTSPSVAVPADDAVVRKIQDALLEHKKDFTGGSFVNAHSTLYFGGGVEGVNALLGDLAKVDGATLRVKLSKDAGQTRWTFPVQDAPADTPCDCRIDHNGWGDARVVTVTVYLGGDRIDPDKLDLPAITPGKDKKDEPKKDK